MAFHAETRQRKGCLLSATVRFVKDAGREPCELCAITCRTSRTVSHGLDNAI